MKTTEEMETPINELSNKENSTERPQGQKSRLRNLSSHYWQKNCVFYRTDIARL